jgi:hypothetical protein
MLSYPLSTLPNNWVALRHPEFLQHHKERMDAMVILNDPTGTVHSVPDIYLISPNSYLKLVVILILKEETTRTNLTN